MAVYAANVPHWLHVAQDAHVLRPDLDAVAVIDGLGGHPGSEHAAQAAALAIARTPDGEQWTRTAMQDARAAVRTAREAACPEHATMTAAALVARRTAEHIEAAWTGDCRLFAFWHTDDGHPWLRILSDDHDFLSQQGRMAPAVQRALRLRLMDAQTQSDAFRVGGAIAKKAFRQGHMMWSDLVDGPVGVLRESLPPGAVVIATTDGVHDNLTGAMMRQLCADTPAAALAQTLVDAAEAVARAGVGKGHPDDITCAVLSG